jgi:amino acid transporter
MKPANPSVKKLSLLEVISMAVGTMIGASIFTIFGFGAQLAGPNLPEAFLLSGMYALIVAYSYSILGAKIISNAGPIGFILKGLGDSILTGALSILFWMCYVISIALLAKGFSSYFLPLFRLDSSYLNTAIVESLLILFFVVLNFFGSKAVGKSEIFIVFAKLSILFVFIVGGIWTIQGENVKAHFDSNHLHGLLNASIIFFLSYMGFGLITNASENIVNPQKNVPRAIFISILVVMAIYSLISLVTLGNLSPQEVSEANENALAIAAQPFLGKAGFLLISIGALLSTSSAMNASIFGGANVAYSLAKNGELPKFFQRKVWFNSTEGLYITAGLGLFFALLFDLGEIASITSTVATVVYIFVLISHIKIRKEYGGNLFLLGFNLVVLNVVCIALVVYQFQSHRAALYGTLLTFIAAVLAEFILRRVTQRELTEHHKI